MNHFNSIFFKFDTSWHYPNPSIRKSYKPAIRDLSLSRTTVGEKGQEIISSAKKTAVA